MKRVCKKISFEDAVREAEEYLTTTYEQEKTKIVKRTEQTKSEKFTTLWDGYGNKVYVYDSFTNKEKEKAIFSIYLTAEEADPKNIIFPYKGVANDILINQILLATNIIKPQRKLTAEEAYTPKGMEIIEDTFDIPFFDNWDDGIGDYTKDDLFTRLSEGDGGFLDLGYSPSPCYLESLTGVAVRSSKDYIKGMETLFNMTFTEEEALCIEQTYSYNIAFLFLNYLIYEFYRTESYEALQEAKERFSIFGLSKDWENSITLRDAEGVKTAEEYVLSCYICPCYFRIFATTSIRRVADYTGAPYDLLLNISLNNKKLIWI